MEVDHYRPAQRCYKCYKVGHRIRDCRSNAPVNAVNSTNHIGENDKKKDMICWYCAGRGHFKRECRKRQADLGRNKNDDRPRENKTNMET